MKSLSDVFKSLGVMMLALVGNNSKAVEPPSALLFQPPPISHNRASIMGIGAEARSLQSANGKDHGRGLSHRFGHLDLTHGKNNPDAPGVTTIPHWSDSFTYNGLVYKYTMVGTDPKKGSATTVIPTVLIPIRFVFADGNVFDATTDIVNGQTPIQGIINSPLFQTYDFNNKAGIYINGSSAGLIKVGNTQYGDAFQRANFWDSISTRSPNYHVLLGQPTVSPVQTINVPYGSFDYYIDPVTGPHPLVDGNILFNLIEPYVTGANISAGTLPIFVWGRVRGFGTNGFHGLLSGNGNTLQTFIGTTYDSGFLFEFSDISGVYFGDAYTLSHEILEWLNDPFTNNFTPGWDAPFFEPAAPLCDSSFIANDLLEVGDVVEDFAQSNIILPIASYNYHVTEGAFIDFFTRSSRSRSYNGQYSFFEFGLEDNFHDFGLPDFQSMPPSRQCTGRVQFTPMFVDFPGAAFTTVMGINNRGSATGVYTDVIGKQHGFFFNGSKYTALDYPNAFATTPFKINDSGTIVGSFIDASGESHGFSYNGGAWMQIDFPGSSDTEVYGINSAGQIVGSYNGLQSVAHAFILDKRQYQSIDTPFGSQAEAFAINDQGSITGVGYTDPFTGHFTLTLLEQMQYLFQFDAEQFFTGPFTPFVWSRNSFSPFQFPGSLVTQIYSINSSNDLAGFIFEPDGATELGMVTISGRPYTVLGIVFGNDDLNHICGSTFDFNTGQLRGFIGTLQLNKPGAR